MEIQILVNSSVLGIFTFLQKYPSKCKKKRVVLNQGEELHENLKCKIFSNNKIVQSILLVQLLYPKMILLNKHIVQYLITSRSILLVMVFLLHTCRLHYFMFYVYEMLIWVSVKALLTFICLLVTKTISKPAYVWMSSIGSILQN